MNKTAKDTRSVVAFQVFYAFEASKLLATGLD